MEVPAALRELADKSVAQARNTFENAKAATEEQPPPQRHLQDRRQGATDYNLKVIEIARTNTNRSLTTPTN